MDICICKICLHFKLLPQQTDLNIMVNTFCVEIVELSVKTIWVPDPYFAIDFVQCQDLWSESKLRRLG